MIFSSLRLPAPSRMNLVPGSRCAILSSPRVPLLPSRRAEHLMGMPQAAQRWTPAMVRALPDDGNRYEVVAGELFVTPAPSIDHQQAVARLLLRLVPYVDAHGLGYALASPADIEFEEEHLVQPDIFVAPRLAGRRPERWSDIKRLLRDPAPYRWVRALIRSSSSTSALSRSRSVCLVR